jgi:hypothetical protein
MAWLFVAVLFIAGTVDVHDWRTHTKTVECLPYVGDPDETTKTLSCESQGRVGCIEEAKVTCKVHF